MDIDKVKQQINQKIRELNRNSELYNELAHAIMTANKIENEEGRLHTGEPDPHRDNILLRMREMWVTRDFKIDKLLEVMVHAGSQKKCEFCITAKFIAVDRRTLTQHLLIRHNHEWPNPEGMKKTIAKMLTYVYAFEYPKDVFRWMGGDRGDKTLPWSLRHVQCTNCDVAKSYPPKTGPPTYCGATKFFRHWLEKHPQEFVTCRMCYGTFGFAGSYLSHRCVGTATPVLPNQPDADADDAAEVQQKENVKDVDLLYYDCEACPPGPANQPFPSFFNFFIHLRNEHNSCEGCLRQFTSQSRLMAHVADSFCATVRPTCWKCPDPLSTSSGPRYVTPTIFNSLEDLCWHEFLAAAHNDDKLKIRCETCSLKKVWYLHHTCTNVEHRGRPSKHAGNFTDRSTSDVALARCIHSMDPTILESYALEFIINGHNMKNNPFNGMVDTKIFYWLQRYAQPLEKEWSLHWWWRISSLQHLLMATRHVLTPSELPKDVEMEVDQDMDQVDVVAADTVDLNQDLAVSDDEEEYQPMYDSDEENAETGNKLNGNAPRGKGKRKENSVLSADNVWHDTFCTCQQYKVGSKMWCCGGADCRYGWFHYGCVRPKKTVGTGPNSKSYCFGCVQQSDSN